MRLLLCLVAATATERRQLSARDRQTTKGLLPNDVLREPQRWVFVHVPKAAGASFMIDARHFITRRDTMTGSEEKGAFSRTTLRKLENGGMRAILLRRPLQLVYSQFLYCKNVLKGKVKDFPGHGQEPAWAGVKEWSNGAKKVTAERGPFWKCYDPRNIQFRFITGEGSALTNKGVSSKTSVEDASRKLDGDFGFVGFVELYIARVVALPEGAPLGRHLRRALAPLLHARPCFWLNVAREVLHLALEHVFTVQKLRIDELQRPSQQDGPRATILELP